MLIGISFDVSELKTHHRYQGRNDIASLVSLELELIFRADTLNLKNYVRIDFISATVNKPNFHTILLAAIGFASLPKLTPLTMKPKYQSLGPCTGYLFCMKNM